MLMLVVAVGHGTAQPAAQRLVMKYVEQAREDLGDSLVKRSGKNVRPPSS